MCLPLVDGLTLAWVRLLQHTDGGFVRQFKRVDAPTIQTRRRLREEGESVNRTARNEACAPIGEQLENS